MEAANRGARDAGGRTVGFNIGLPHEQKPNPYITPGLSFQFHYFFMRKLWFAHTACALVAFPGGFGTLDEMFEILTLQQTAKLDRKITMLLYGSDYWREIVDFEALVRHGTIDRRISISSPSSTIRARRCARCRPGCPRRRRSSPPANRRPRRRPPSPPRAAPMTTARGEHELAVGDGSAALAVLAIEVVAERVEALAEEGGELVDP